MNTDTLQKMINELQLEILYIHESLTTIDSALHKIVYITRELSQEEQKSE